MWKLKREVNESHVYVDRVFTEQELETLLKLVNDPQKEKGTTFNEENLARNSHVRWIDIVEDEALHFAYNRISEIALVVNDRFYNFELNELEPLQFTEYQVGGYYKQHQDFGYDRGVYRKLSLVVQLTDEDAYEGGDLMIYDGTFGGIKAPRKKNTLIAFPSWQLHEVLPVTKGVRHSLVGWVIGANRFK